MSERRRQQKPLPESDQLVLPHNIEAERSVLGAILVHSDALDVVSAVIKPADFYRDAHRRVYQAMLAMSERKTAIDHMTLCERLTQTKELEEVGGPAYVAKLSDGVPRSTNAAHYAKIVKEKATLRNIIFAADDILTTAYLGEDPAEMVLQQADKKFLDIHNGTVDNELVDMRGVTSRITADLEYRHAHRGELLGLDTGFEGINMTTFGWQPGQLIVIAARPSIGKTTFALNTIVAAAKTAPVAVFSLEMKLRQLETRMLSALSGVPATRLLSGYYGDEDWTAISQATAAMAELQLAMTDRPGQTTWDIRSRCRRMRTERGLGMVVIDYVQLMPGTLERRNASRNEEVTDISRRLKELAGDLNVPILLLSQLNRANEKRDDPRPKLSDLRESGALEQDADLVCFLHRSNHKEGGLTKFIIEKQRDGATGTVNLFLERDTIRFRQATVAEETPPPKPAKEKTEGEEKGSRSKKRVTVP